MKTLNAVKRLSKFGEVQKNDHNQYWIESESQILSFIDQGGDALCIHVKSKGDESDIYTDYFPGYFPRSLKAAIEDVFAA